MTHGLRVRIARDLDISPTGIFPAGLTGRVVAVNPDEPLLRADGYGRIFARVVLDHHFPELDEWENAIDVWSKPVDDCDVEWPGSDLFEAEGAFQLIVSDLRFIDNPPLIYRCETLADLLDRLKSDLVQASDAVIMAILYALPTSISSSGFLTYAGDVAFYVLRVS